MTIDEIKEKWIAGTTVVEIDIDESGTRVALSEMNNGTFSLYRFFKCGNSYRVSVDKREKPLAECIKRMMYLQRKYT